jgi:hypothetical protein
LREGIDPPPHHAAAFGVARQRPQIGGTDGRADPHRDVGTPLAEHLVGEQQHFEIELHAQRLAQPRRPIEAVGEAAAHVKRDNGAVVTLGQANE